MKSMRSSLNTSKVKKTHIASMKPEATTPMAAVVVKKAEEKEPMSTEAYELQLYIENDGDLYRQQNLPIIKNLMRKKAAGIYDHDKAVKLFGYLIESGAKKYAKENDVTMPWHEMFNVKSRKQTAEAMTEAFESDAANGEYDEYIPKKYQKFAHEMSDRSDAERGIDDSDL
jgi:hypothetical protein